MKRAARLKATLSLTIIGRAYRQRHSDNDDFRGSDDESNTPNPSIAVSVSGYTILSVMRRTIAHDVIHLKQFLIGDHTMDAQTISQESTEINNCNHACKRDCGPSPVPDEGRNTAENSNTGAEPWRQLNEADALAYLVERDVERRGNTPWMQLHALGLTGIRNRRKLVAWREEHRLCKKCGRAIPATSHFKHCDRCCEVMRETQRRKSRNLTEDQRIARNAKARRWYHEQVSTEIHAEHVPADPAQLDIEAAIEGAGGVVTPMVTHADEVVTASTAKRDRAEYMRDYRAAKRAEAE